MLIDTHCHIQESYAKLPPEEVIVNAKKQGVTQMIVVGTDQESSRQAVEFAKKYTNTFSAIGVHPHDSKDGCDGVLELAAKQPKRLVAVGEIGLDYYYMHSKKSEQKAAFKTQIELAVKYNLPIIFHVRNAFDDFWPIFDSYPGLRGVLHSYTDSKENLEIALKKGLYIGVNGISTFTKDEEQKKVFDSIPTDRLLFETDAPFLTPAPYRGKINEPAYVRAIAEYHAKRRGISVEEIAIATTNNARTLFGLSK